MYITCFGEHIKLGISIHPAGEWLLDNYYILEETYKTILKNMTLKKYKSFIGISDGIYSGFARIYVLASEIIAYTDSKIDSKTLSELLGSYQKKKNLTMDEMWNIGIFLQIALIEKIREICEKIYYSQMQKYRVENILERLIDKPDKLKYKNISEYKQKVKSIDQIKNPFIEYMSYRLKKYGKSAYAYINVLEEEVEKLGITVDEVIRKEHFDIAIRKVSMANSILSIRELLHIDYSLIFQNINEVEELLRKDPAGIYSKMDYRTKECYRNAVKEIASKAKVSEIYTVNKILEICKKVKEKEIDYIDKKDDKEIIKNEKQKHVGYYLIGDGKQELINIITGKKKRTINNNTKMKLYILSIWSLTIIINLLIGFLNYKVVGSYIVPFMFFILLLLPIQEIVVKLIHFVLSKIVKPKIIPKLDFENGGVPKEYSTFIVIPTIIKSKEKVEELFRKLEVFYLANKSDNLYFALLGDCSSGPNKDELYDKEIEEEGIKQVNILNEKYKTDLDSYQRFNFIYRKRFWNGKEECYLGWERKRGLLNQFNEYLLGNIDNPFKINTIENWKKEEKITTKIKYIITLDSDTQLVLNTGLELIGAMAHILNVPEENDNKDCVVNGYGILQPRIGINLEACRVNTFTKIFAGSGGVDPYTNAISDIYQDNFGEGIFTGKGIYDLEVFSKVLKDEIPDNMVLSHDLLEGSYLRCGLASDIMLMDGYPTSYLSSKIRTNRWIRGDFQICSWLRKKIVNNKEIQKNNPINCLSKYKIFDNLIRSILPITVIITFFISVVFNEVLPAVISLLSICMPTIIDILNRFVIVNYYTINSKIKYQKRFDKTINSFIASILRAGISIGTLPDTAYNNLNAIIKSVYRMKISKKHLLEWTTAEEAENNNKTDLFSYNKKMVVNIISGIVLILLSNNTLVLLTSILWIIFPTIMWYMARKPNNDKLNNMELFINSKIENKKENEDGNKKEKENENENENRKEKNKSYLLDIGLKTWKYFKDSINEKNNYLPPDNYQEDRKQKFISRTSSTNIGLGLLAVISSYDLGFESLYDTLVLLNNMLNTIEKLQKWNGHLYNWYDTRTLEPLLPRYISTVDSGNFVSYIYTLKSFYIEIKNKLLTCNDDNNNTFDEKERKRLLELIPYWVDLPINEIPIAKADFRKLYDEEKKLFSIGFNIEDNRLTKSYYDLLASEARNASLISIAKRDIPSKHWYCLSRTLTAINGYKGLISWSGTAFEYLMPNIIIKRFKGSLLDESCKFMIKSQKEYAKKLGIPWGFSETAFNTKDLNNNYQYKAIGIPWLGLKRGLEDDIVVSPYSSFLSIEDAPLDAINNLKRLEKYKMVNKYGFYESLDFTPIRLRKNKKYEIVKTYMAHHQALILLSINNYLKNNILQKRFHLNPEIEALDVLLEEKMPENMIITNEEKKKPEKIKYYDYENYSQRCFNKKEIKLQEVNAISNDNYLIVMNHNGNGYSKYKDVLINRYKPLSDENQGIFFYFKDIKNKRVWTSNYINNIQAPDKYEVDFSEDANVIKRVDGPIETKTQITIAQEEPVEIRNVVLKNNGIEDETIEITSYLEPVLSKAIQDYSHPAFNKLFLSIEDVGENILLVKRRKRKKTDEEIYLAVTLYSEKGTLGELEYEIDKERFTGRGNINIPISVENSKILSKKTELSIDPCIAMKQTINIKPQENASISLIISVNENKNEAIDNLKKYTNNESINKCFELSRARVEAEARYLGINSKDIETYQKMLGYILYNNPLRSLYLDKIKKENYSQNRLWKYGISGDLPIVFLIINTINDIYVLEDVLKAYEFYKAKNIKIDLVILDKEENNYEKYVKEEIINSILNKNLAYELNISGGIFIIEDQECEALLKFRSNLFIDGSKGQLSRQLKDLEDDYLELIEKNQIGYESQKNTIINEEKNTIVFDINNNDTNNATNNDNVSIKYYNEYGGFINNGKEYRIIENKDNRIPTTWSHIIGNEKFGSVITDSMGGYTWSYNSRLNRLTSWSNDQVLDIPSEIIYIQEKDSLKTWSLGLNPMPDNNDYGITYGFGYAIFEHQSLGIKQSLTLFIPKNDSLKINILNLKNNNSKKQRLKIVYYIKPVLGEDEIYSNGNIELKYKKNNNVILFNNRTDEKEQYAYISCSEKIKSYTGNKDSFIGNGTISNPEALKRVGLDNSNSLGHNNVIAMQIEVELEPYESKDISFMLGEEKSIDDCLDIAYKYSNISKCYLELESVKKYWEEFLSGIQINTPVESFNILLNGWMAYQSLVCRLWARSGFYQSGGAFGFRDQLQDTLGLKYYDINIMKNQIIKHASHQFIEGDVEHWWHENENRGIRTKFSDDLLWLVYVTCEYIKQTGDYDILNYEIPFKIGDTLKTGIDEHYDTHEQSIITQSLFEHCIKAIEKSLNFGEHGLPLIGSGDWNDGMSTVGNKGKGESIWLGFFLYDVLNRFVEVIKNITNNKNIKNDNNDNSIDYINLSRIEKYERIMEELKKALNTSGWDGRWYKRAYTDDGDELGSLKNEECKIDGISQSWAIISNAGDNDKKYISLDSLENHLIDKENGIIKLLDPPFDKSKLEPGYIKAYIPGTRENGGQYTHGAIWAIIAECLLEFGDKATELFRMINPIEHSKTKDAINKYKVEPYVIAADIYGSKNLNGRGGWTWYTGSSSWMIKAGIEYILGLRIKDGFLSIEPCISSQWKEYSIRYKYKSSIYNIKINNPNGKNTGIESFIVNGRVIDEKKLKLEDDGKIYNIEVII